MILSEAGADQERGQWKEPSRGPPSVDDRTVARCLSALNASQGNGYGASVTGLINSPELNRQTWTSDVI
jgi:hypothetical protein